MVEILLISPFIALGVAFIVSQHDSHIVTIASYCSHELDQALRDSDEWIVPWDKSESMRGFENRLIFSRLWSHVLIISLPPVVSLASNINHALQSPFPLGVAWWCGLMSTAITIYVPVDAARYRRGLYEKYPKQ